MGGNVYMIHGIMSGPWVWDNYRHYFEREGYTCAAATLRYHDMELQGKPDPALGTTGLLDYAADLEREISAFDDRPILIGHSMGGLLAQIMAARGLAKALVLLTPVSPAGIMLLTPSAIRTFLRVHARWGFWRKPFRLGFNDAAYGILNKLPVRRQKEIYANFVYESGRVLCEAAYWFLDPKRASSVDEARVICPVLIINCMEDRVTPASVVRKIYRKYKHVATCREYTDHAHWPMAEPGWEKIARDAADWLRELPAGSNPG